jgi:von Willebrand factor type A domain
MSWSLRPLLLVFSLLLFAGGPAPQAYADRPKLPETANTPPEKNPAVQFGGEEVAVGYVLVPVIVRSNSGGYANRLDKKDFRLLVDGRESPIESFETRAEAPASLLFLQDLSGSMGTGGKLEESRRAVRYFLERSQPGDEFSLATFGGGRLSVGVPFTGDLAALRSAVDAWRPYGTTALNDAVAWLPDAVTASRKSKRFAILITDGVDNASTLTPEAARGNPFEIGPDGKKLYRYADVLNLLAHQTGGRYYPLSNPDGLGKALAAIVEDLRHEYVLGFATGEGRPRYHDLRVEVTGKNRSVLFRRGYNGPPPSSVRGG